MGNPLRAPLADINLRYKQREISEGSVDVSLRIFLFLHQLLLHHLLHFSAHFIGDLIH